jgi:hypothetical protein
MGEPLFVLNGHTDGANYRAEGEPTTYVDVAITEYHDHIRLAVWDDTEAREMEAVLSPDAARHLIDQLTAALPDASP